MVKLLLSLMSAALLSGCSLTLPSISKPVLNEPTSEINITDLEFLEDKPLETFPFPEDIPNLIKGATVVKKVMEGDTVMYVPTDPEAEETNEELFVILDVETQFKIKTLYQAARENKKVADQLNNIVSLSVEERNQLLRVLRAEYYRMERLQAFNTYYKEELDAQQMANSIEVWSWKLVAVLGLAVGL